MNEWPSEVVFGRFNDQIEVADELHTLDRRRTIPDRRFAARGVSAKDDRGGMRLATLNDRPRVEASYSRLARIAGAAAFSPARNCPKLREN
jgi:hypothetical protein